MGVRIICTECEMIAKELQLQQQQPVMHPQISPKLPQQELPPPLQYVKDIRNLVVGPNRLIPVSGEVGFFH